MKKSERAKTRINHSFNMVIKNLETLSKNVYIGEVIDVKPGLDVKELPEYDDAVASLAKLKETVLTEYAEHIK